MDKKQRKLTQIYVPCIYADAVTWDLKALQTGSNRYFRISESLFYCQTATQRNGMLSRTEKISGFHLKVSWHERELYEEFCNSAEAEILREMRDYFTEAKQRSGVVNFHRLGLWSKIQNRIDLWLGEACIWRHLNPN